MSRGAPPATVFLAALLAASCAASPAQGAENRSCDISGRDLSAECRQVCGRGEQCELRAAVILPQDASQHEVSLAPTLAALDLAGPLLPANFSMRLLPADDQCEPALATAHAVEAIARRCAHVLFGPYCEYSLATVARFVKYFGTPLLTSGGLSMDFMRSKASCDSEYHMLVRVGTLSYLYLSLFLIHLMEQNGWKKVMLIYEKNAYARLGGENTCQLFMMSLVEELKKKNVLYHAYDMEKSPSTPIEENLRREMQLIYSSKY